MTDVKISAMTASGNLTGAEIVPVVQGGANVRTTTGAIGNLAASSPSVLVETGASAKVSAMTAAAALTGAEIVPVVQGGANVRTTLLDVGNATYSFFGETTSFVQIKPSGNATGGAGTEADFAGGDGAAGGNHSGGDTALLAGAATGTATGGGVSITGGSGDTGNAGPVNINGGFSTSAHGGNVNIAAGRGATQAGSVSISGAAPTAGNVTGGAVTITGGAGSGTGARGPVKITNLPTTDPHVVGQLWVGNISGNFTMQVSQG